ncbi:MAG: hypothetical protein J0L75_10760 [Spirochaetes bacterium]|nr:hypothetical protein [Spirochaetota bacterium]
MLLTNALLATLLFLETPTARLAIDAARGGALVSLVDKKSGREFINARTGPLLYEIRLGGGSKALISEADARDVTVSREENALRIRSARHEGAALRVECRLWVDASDLPPAGDTAAASFPVFRASIEISNGSGAELQTVRFPCLTWSNHFSADTNGEFLMLPRNDGCLVQDPGSQNATPQSPYPGSASLQCLAWYDRAAGLYADLRDANGWMKMLGVERRGDALRLSFLHGVPRSETASYLLPYDVTFGTFSGDWQTAASHYKRWAVKQAWCRKTLAQRVGEGEMPKWLLDPSLFYVYTARGILGSNLYTNRMDRMLPQARAWKELLGSPVVLMPCGWEKKDIWVTPDYFPPLGGAKAFAQLNQDLHREGHHAFVFLSGLKWTLEKRLEDRGVRVDQWADFSNRGMAWATVSTQGVVQIDGAPDRDVGRNASICVATPMAREILLGNTLAGLGLGLDVVQADQIVGGGVPVCWATGHGHPPGYGNWAAKALYALYERIRREGRAAHPDFAWSMEEPNEYFMPVLDTVHARDYAQGRWPRDGRTTIGIPLFSHVYHEYQHGYGGDSCAVSDKKGGNTLYQQGMNLVCGRAPAVAVWTRDYDPATTHPFQIRLLKGHLELWKTKADFLALGEREESRDLPAPRLLLKFWQGSGKPQRELEVPAVLRGAWVNARGARGEVWACIADAAVTITNRGEAVTLEPGEVRWRE